MFSAALQVVLSLTNEELVMRHGLRRLTPQDFKTPVETNKPGPMPELILVEIWRLCVDDEYQRDITLTGRKRIDHMAQHWDWEKYTPISIVLAAEAAIDEAGTTLYEVIDGQHEAIAAATNGNITHLPAVLKTSKTLKEKADAFIGINKRVAVPAYHKYSVALAAGDQDAIGVSCALSYAKCELLETPPPQGRYKVGDTLALSSMLSIVRRQGEAALTRALRTGKAANCAPIGADLLKALVMVGKSDDDATEVDHKLINFISVKGAKRIEMEANAEREVGEPTAAYIANMLFKQLQISKPKVQGATNARRALPR